MIDASRTEAGAGKLIAERLGLTVLGVEGHDLRCACIACDSSDALRVHQDKGIAQCFSCGRAWSAFDLCKTVLRDHQAAIQLMVDAQLFDPSYASNGNGQASGRDIIGEVARKKRCSRAGLEAFRPKVRGECIILPMYGGDGKVCSEFRLPASGGKGLNKKGKPTGVFLPGRRPKPGESWLLVEGPKDAAAAVGLGYLAAGLPTNHLHERFTELFRDVDVTIVPDCDRAGIDGAKRTAAVLRGVAASVRIAQLPAEFSESNGQDVRDILESFGARGPDAIRRAIDEARPAEELAGQGKGESSAPAEPPRFVNVLTCAEFLAADFRQEFLVEGVLAAGSPGVVGGRSKSLKTSVSGDLAVSLGSGTPFLGEFRTRRCMVGFWSGESGPAVIRETAVRIAKSKGVDLADCSIVWGFDLPKLSRADHLAALAGAIEHHGLEVVIVDPLYLSLLDASDNGKPSDLFYMGAKLQPLTELGQSMGATILLLHHFRKNSNAPDDEPASLEELAQSGVAEWARQWILLSRRVPYQNDGRHELYMRTGGSAGHAGAWSLSIDEGILDPETFTGRKWEVEISSVADVRENTRAERRLQRERQKEIAESEHRHAVFSVLIKNRDGETAKRLRAAARLNPDNFEKAIVSLLEEGYAEECEVEKGKRSFDGYRPTKKAFEGEPDQTGPDGTKADQVDAWSG